MSSRITPVREKRKRRAASPSTKGLIAGEKLNRNRLLVESDIRWNWIGTNVKHASDITKSYQLRAAGLVPSKSRPICSNQYSRKPRFVETRETKGRAAGEDPDDVIVISDEDDGSTCEKKRCRDNPFCLNYLGQNSWEDEESAEKAYLKANIKDTDPRMCSRRPTLPVGLRNLGATCYANAFLQVWFQDLAFRSGVYKCQPSSNNIIQFKDSPIFQLQVTFAALQMGDQSVFNPSKLVESLRLRTSEQQDAQEFSKLFMSHLDDEFKKQSHPELKSLLPSQFEGKMIHATVCDKCKTRSQRESPFLELEINLQKDSSLEDRIASILAPERLTDDNRYLCSICDSLQDATRYTEISSLPPVLHISLLRFVYDLATYERRKSKLPLKIPPYLNMKPFLQTSDPNQMEVSNEDEDVYELRGVLLHRGQSAYHGHYEAQVYSQMTKRWYQFNDEVVTPLPSFTMPETGDDGDDDGNSRPAKRQKRATKTRRVEDSEDDDVHQKSSPIKPIPMRYLSSKDAYMLIYARKKTNNSIEESMLVPPVEALSIVRSMNEKHDLACEEYSLRRQTLKEEFAKKRAIVMDIYQSWNISSPSEPSSVVSRSALEGWVSRWLSSPDAPAVEVKVGAAGDCRTTSTAQEPNIRTDSIVQKLEEDKSELADEEFPEHLFSSKRSSTSTAGAGTAATSGIIDNSVLLCPHGRLNPLSDKEMKLISISAKEKIEQNGFTFKPHITVDDICTDCVKAEFLEKHYQMLHPQLVAEFNEICNVDTEFEGCWISKPWLKDWQLNRPKMHKASCEDPPPDGPDFYQNVKCEHGFLTLNLSGRRRISYEATRLLQRSFPSWDPPPWDAELCSACEAMVHISKESKLEQRKKAETEKALLPRLQEANVFGRYAMIKDTPCAIIPSEFVREWRSWIQRPGDAQRPTSVDNSHLMCEHGDLNINLTDGDDFNEDLAVVSVEEWETISSLYTTGPLVTVNTVTDGSNGTGKEVIMTDKPCCHDCRSKEKLNFTSTSLTVIFLKNNEEIPRALPSTSSQSSCNKSSSQPNGNGEVQTRGDMVLPYFGRVNGTRQSRRLKDSKLSQRRIISVFKTTTVKDMKVNLQKVSNIPTVSQRLFYRGKELEDSSETVEKLQIMERDILYLKEVEEDAIVLDSDGDEISKPARKRDEGNAFRGTLLSGSFPVRSSTTPEDGESQRNSDSTPAVKTCLTCTYDNELNSAECLMCAHPLSLDQ